MSDVRLYLLGAPRIAYRDMPVNIERHKAFALAAYFAVTKQSKSREFLAELLWPDLDHEPAQSALLSTLRALTTSIPVEWV